MPGRRLKAGTSKYQSGRQRQLLILNSHFGFRGLAILASALRCRMNAAFRTRPERRIYAAVQFGHFGGPDRAAPRSGALQIAVDFQSTVGALELLRIA
jgi:hypothetical protein